jgi:dTDP-4-amino-4,6-dideoxygalactose transaminase
MKKINFNEPFFSKNDYVLLNRSLKSKNVSGNGYYTNKCHTYFSNKFKFKNSLLTTSCTDALEMCAILINIQKGDEVIVPSFTFVSTANAFALRGAKIKFVDSEHNNPNISIKSLKSQLSKKTKCVIIVHYAGLPCDLDEILRLQKKYKFILIEDSAHAINMRYKKKYLGSFGDLATFSFHQTKNITCGEGGLLVINNKKFLKRAKVIWEKGTNRNDFAKGFVKKYEWIDIGSSFLPSDITASLLYSQLLNIPKIQKKREKLWNRYFDLFKNYKKIIISSAYNKKNHNAHMFYIMVKNERERNNLKEYLSKKKIFCFEHYNCLHLSKYAKINYKSKSLYPNAINYEKKLLRLPLHCRLGTENIELIVKTIKKFYDR